MLYIKDKFPNEQFEKVYEALWTSIWEKHLNIGKPEVLSEVLAAHFEEREVKAIIAAAATQEYKDALLNNTKKAVELGAFGSPFFSVRNDDGVVEPFFGSDRFHYMFDFLALPVSHLSIKEGSKL